MPEFDIKAFLQTLSQRAGGDVLIKICGCNGHSRPHVRREPIKETGILFRPLSEVRLAGRVAVDEGLTDVCVFGR